MTLTVECDRKSITTIEGLKEQKTGELNPLQRSFVDRSAFQCGFCTPGIIVTAQALLDKTPEPSESEIQEALAGPLLPVHISLRGGRSGEGCGQRKAHGDRR